jgi:hypothetical protein
MVEKKMVNVFVLLASVSTMAMASCVSAKTEGGGWALPPRTLACPPRGRDEVHLYIAASSAVRGGSIALEKPKMAKIARLKP